MGSIASQITSLAIVYSTVYSGADQRKHESSASPAFVRGIHRWPVNSPHKGPVTWKMFPFDDVIMKTERPYCGANNASLGNAVAQTFIFIFKLISSGCVSWNGINYWMLSISLQRKFIRKEVKVMVISKMLFEINLFAVNLSTVQVLMRLSLTTCRIC